MEEAAGEGNRKQPKVKETLLCSFVDVTTTTSSVVVAEARWSLRQISVNKAVVA